MNNLDFSDLSSNLLTHGREDTYSWDILLSKGLDCKYCISPRMGASLESTSMLTCPKLVQLEEIIANLALGGKVFSVDSSLVTSARRQEVLRRSFEHWQASLLPL